MYAQFFGNFLLSQNVVTKKQLIDAIEKKSSEHIKLGTLAIHEGYMSANEVDQIVILQTHNDKRFGELAIEQGYLTDDQVQQLLRSQSPDFLLLGQVLVDNGVITNHDLESLINEYESENELYDLDYIDEKKEVVDQLLTKFFYVTQKPLNEYELSFTRLLFNNLIRFIGEDFTPLCPTPCAEYPSNYCVSQKISGPFTLNVFIDMPETACIEFASRYVGDTFTDFDEYVQASIEDFLNLHNGLFNVNISNSDGVELKLDPPVIETAELLTFQPESYLMPVIYPFGTINFIFEITKTL